MKNRNELTPRKKAEVISENSDFESATQKFREDSSKPVAETSIEDDNDSIEEKLGLKIKIEKCIDVAQGNSDITIKIESVEDYNCVECEPSNMVYLFDRLADIGYPITNEDKSTQDIIRDFINKKRRARDYVYTHQKIGWGYHLGQKMIKLSKIEAEQGTIQSEYIGGLKLSQKGTVDDFVQGVKDLIIGIPRLELQLILGACGLLVQELDESDTNIVVNEYGKSSSGKSQSTKISLMLFGDPNRLFMTFNSTENRVEKEMAEYQILPVIMDDRLVGVDSLDRKKQCQTIVKDIFRYATGHVKGRTYDKDSFIKYYCPIILSTEESIVELMKSALSKGQFFRMFEIPCKRGELTTSKEHSEQLERFMRSSYGVAGEVFAQWLMKNGMYGDKLKDKFFEWHEKIVKDFGQVDYAHRMANRMAVIMLAGELLNSCFNFGINLNEVQQLLMESVKIAFSKANEEDVHIKGLKEYLNTYKEYFADCKKDCDRYKHLGQYKKNEYGYYELWVEPDALRYILSGKEPRDYLDYSAVEDNGEKFDTSKRKRPVERTSLTQILQAWKSKGILISGRKSGTTSTLTVQKTLFNGDNKQQNIYIIQFREEE